MTTACPFSPHADPPRRRCYSVRIWFSRTRAEQAARRWAWGMFETEPHTIINDRDL